MTPPDQIARALAIMIHICERYHITDQRLKDKCREWRFVWPRWCAIALVRKYTALDYHIIASLFDRDITGIRSALLSHADHISLNQPAAAEYAALERHIETSGLLDHVAPPAHLSLFLPPARRVARLTTAVALSAFIAASTIGRAALLSVPYLRFISLLSCLLCLLCFTSGCVTTAASSSSSSSKSALKAASPSIHQSTNPPIQHSLPFRYPITNQFYTIERSTNLVTWLPVPGYQNCYGPPTTNHDLCITNNLSQPCDFYRARPHKDYEPISPITP